jgi:ribonuclease HI
MAVELKEVTIYTDGAAEPNPGPGGWGVVLLHGGHRKEISGGFRKTTNNRMELRAVIEGLKALKSLCVVRLHCDSKYVVEAMTQGWAKAWQEKEFLKKGQLMSNADLWKELLELCDLHKVTFVWVKGHAGDVENERCDVLAMAALEQKDLPADEIYEDQCPAEGQVQELGGGARRPARPWPGVNKEKITEEGQACRKCGAAVEKRFPKKKGKGAYYYEWYLICPKCGTMYMVDEAKRYG